MSEDPNLEGQYPIGESEIIFPKLLKRVGYSNGMVGKWGLGPPNSNSIPTKMGFDYFYGYNCQRMAHNLYPPHIWENESRDMLDNKVISPRLKLKPDQDPLDENNYEVFNKNDYAPDKMHIRRRYKKNPDNPFFLYYAGQSLTYLSKYLIDKPEKLLMKNHISVM